MPTGPQLLYSAQSAVNMHEMSSTVQVCIFDTACTNPMHIEHHIDYQSTTSTYMRSSHDFESDSRCGASCLCQCCKDRSCFGRMLTSWQLVDGGLDEARPHNHVTPVVDEDSLPGLLVQHQELWRPSDRILVIDDVPCVGDRLQCKIRLLVKHARKWHLIKAKSCMMHQKLAQPTASSGAYIG